MFKGAFDFEHIKYTGGGFVSGCFQGFYGSFLRAAQFMCSWFRAFSRCSVVIRTLAVIAWRLRPEGHKNMFLRAQLYGLE